MTGYVRPCKAHLNEKDWETYQAVYCGVCRALGKRYGQAFRSLLSYDMVFYAILLSRGPAELRLRRCAAHPIKSRAMAESTPAMDLAADATILLAVGQLQDRIRDGRFFERSVSRIGLAALRKAYRKASRRLPEAARSMEENLARLGELEAAEVRSLDQPAAAFSSILSEFGEATPDGEAIETKTKRVRAEVLRHLGRWIYLIDACDDYESDLRRGLYNPVAARYELEESEPKCLMPVEVKTEMRRTLGKSREAAAAAFDIDNTCAYRAIAENILTVGLAAAEQRVFKEDIDGPIRGSGRRSKGVHGRSEARIPGAGGKISPR